MYRGSRKEKDSPEISVVEGEGERRKKGSEQHQGQKERPHIMAYRVQSQYKLVGLPMLTHEDNYKTSRSGEIIKRTDSS